MRLLLAAADNDYSNKNNSNNSTSSDSSNKKNQTNERQKEERKEKTEEHGTNRRTFEKAWVLYLVFTIFTAESLDIHGGKLF